MKFPKDIPKSKVISILKRLGFEIVREGNHIAMIRDNPDGSKTPLTMPNHKRIKGSTLRTIITWPVFHEKNSSGYLKRIEKHSNSPVLFFVIWLTYPCPPQTLTNRGHDQFLVRRIRFIYLLYNFLPVPFPKQQMIPTLYHFIRPLFSGMIPVKYCTTKSIPCEY